MNGVNICNYVFIPSGAPVSVSVSTRVDYSLEQTFTSHFLRARHCPRHFINIDAFNPHTSSLRKETEAQSNLAMVSGW